MKEDGTFSNNKQNNILRTVFQNARKNGLTSKQKIIIDAYYIKKMKLKNISYALGLKTPTVHKHLTKSRLKIFKILSYFKK